MDDFCDVAREITFTPVKYSHDIESFVYKEVFRKVQKEINEELDRFQQLKFQLSLQVQMSKLRDTERITMEPHFNSEVKMCINKDFVTSVLHESFNDIISFFESFNSEGSGWYLDRIIGLKMYICKFVPFQGGNCRLAHLLPPSIKKKHAVLTINSPGDECFLYAIMASLWKKENNAQRYLQYKRYIKKLKQDFLTYPVGIKQIPRFEENNNVSVNVYGYEKVIYPLYVSSRDVPVHRQIDLLLHKQHYYCIRKLSALVNDCSTSKGHKKNIICRRCLSAYKTQGQLDVHKQFCKSNGQIFTLPSPGTTRKFSNHCAQYQTEFVIYYDFEALAYECDTPERTASKMKKVTTHIPISIAAKRVCMLSEHDGDLFTYTGRDCVKKFMEYLDHQAGEIDCIHDRYSYPIDMTERASKKFYEQKNCPICKEVFGVGVRKVADHFHMIEKDNFRSALCNRCNLTYAGTFHNIPVIAHNSNRYDTKLILSEFGRCKDKKRKLNVIAKNKEQFCFMRIDRFTLLDSCSFLGASLETVTQALHKKGKQYFKHVCTFEKDTKKQELLFRKQIFPYSFLNSTEKLKYPGLPPQEAFFNVLTDQGISDDDYQHALKVFDVFKCKDFEDYLTLYVRLDTLLLTDIFETWRKMCFNNYGLEIVKYVSLPSYAFDVLLKMTGVELELISSIDIFNFINSSVRGGQCNATHRYGVANNKYLKDYDPRKPDEYILHYDVTNLYGTVMCQSPIPLSHFRWLSDKEIDNFNIYNLNPDGEIGYFVEVSLEYPESIHDLTSDFPFCPQQTEVPPSWWSDYTAKIAETYKHPVRTGGTKLLATLMDKDHYVVHYSLLQFYLSHGMVLKKIYRVLSFKQSKWMKKYILFNTEKRKKAESKFEQDLYKLMINAVFGFSLMSHKNRIDFKLVTDKETFLKWSSKPRFKGFQIINDGLAGVEMKVNNVKLGHPLYIGTTILEMAKKYNYVVYYDYFKVMYKEIKLGYSDTDCFLVLIKGQDPYEDMQYNSHLFDTSNFDENHPLYSTKRKKKLGTLKSETAGDPIRAFCALRSKSYSILLDKNFEVKKSKGIKSHILSKRINFQDYVDALHLSPLKEYSFYSIRSIKNNLYTVKSSRVGLSPMDDKRYLCSNGIDTLAFGHWRIQKHRDEEIWF